MKLSVKWKKIFVLLDSQNTHRKNGTDGGLPPLNRRDKEDEEPEGTYHDQCVMAAAAEEAAGAWGEGGAWGAVEAQRRSRPLMRSEAGTSKKGQMTANG